MFPLVPTPPRFPCHRNRHPPDSTEDGAGPLSDTGLAALLEVVLRTFREVLAEGSLLVTSACSSSVPPSTYTLALVSLHLLPSAK